MCMLNLDKMNTIGFSVQTFSLLIVIIQMTVHVSDAEPPSEFASQITVNTPARSYSHGVGDPISKLNSRSSAYQFQLKRGVRRLRIPTGPAYVQANSNGYPRVKPTIPFYTEEGPRDNSLNVPWQHRPYHEDRIPLLPQSPYRVDSPNPESLWPEGLFLPPIKPHRFINHGSFNRRTGDNGQVLSDDKVLDPYLLEGSEAIAAVTRANTNGELFFHLIPHIDSLLENQETRVKNKLKPHRIASIRHTWPYNRP